MLKNYFSLLQHAKQAMTNVGKSGATITDYLSVVDYEIQVLFFGLAYILGIIALFIFPVVWYRYAFGKKIRTAYTLYREKRQEYSLFRVQMKHLHKQYKSLSGEEQSNLYKDIAKMFNEKGIPLLNENDLKKDFDDLLPYESNITTEKAEAFGVFADMIKISHDIDKLCRMETSDHIIRISIFVVGLIVYAILTIPFVLMLLSTTHHLEP